MTVKSARKEAIASLLLAPKGALDALHDLLCWELEDAQAELESAQDTVFLWRAQGRVMEIRSLLAAMTTKKEG